MTNESVKVLNKIIKSIDFDEKLIGASILRELGKIGQRLYKICKNEKQKKELAKNIIKIKNLIDQI